MVKKRGNKRIYIIAGSILGALVVVFGIVGLVNSLSSGKADPYKQTSGTQITNENDASSDGDAQPEDTKPADSSNDTKPADDTNSSTLDPTTVSTINIDPMNITVSYVKGIGGFEYAVKRTASGTQYVEFSSPELVGTKCTNDTGAFASILANPGSSENATIAKSTTVDGTKYGLSLSAANCTRDEALLKQYQASFSDAFDLLKKI